MLRRTVRLDVRLRIEAILPSNRCLEALSCFRGAARSGAGADELNQLTARFTDSTEARTNSYLVRASTFTSTSFVQHEVLSDVATRRDGRPMADRW